MNQIEKIIDLVSKVDELIKIETIRMIIEDLEDAKEMIKKQEDLEDADLEMFTRAIDFVKKNYYNDEI